MKELTGTGLELILYLGLGLKKHSNYLTGFGLTFSVYDIFDLDLRNTQHKDYLTELGLILLNTGLEQLRGCRYKHGCRYKSIKTFLN